MRDRLCCFAFSVLALLLAACGSAPTPAKRAPAPTPVEVVEVRSQAVTAQLDAVGSLEPAETVQIAARVPGAVERLAFAEGDAVSQGQVLAAVDHERYRLLLARAAASERQAVAEHEQAEAGLARRLVLPAGQVSGDELDAWRARASAASAAVAERQAVRASAALDAAHAEVVAPFAGIIQSRGISTGQWVQAGTVVATLVRRDPLRLRLRVPAIDAARLEPGQQVAFSLPGTAATGSAVLVLVAAAADAQTRMVEVLARVDAAGGASVAPRALVAGSFAEARIRLGTNPRALVVPVAALRPGERSTMAYRIIDSADGTTAELVPVRTGLRAGDGLVEILSGLDAGDRVVVRGSDNLVRGAKVQVAFAATAAAPRSSGSATPGTAAPSGRFTSASAAAMPSTAASSNSTR